MVVISNGHFKFILAPLAAEVARNGMLSLFLTGGYPNRFVLRKFGGRRLRPAGFHRFVARHEPGIPETAVRAKNFSELLVQFGMLVKKATGRTAWGQHFEMIGMRQYGRSAVKDIESSDAKIYHFRSGYGHESVLAARRCGMVTICDHSLPNPEVLDYLVENGGRWPESTAGLARGPWSELMMDDLRRADFLAVNSDFVKESFVRFGWDPERIYVHYTGVDDDFMQVLPARSNIQNEFSQFLFAGELSRRKGAEVLLAALPQLKPRNFRFEVIGPVSEDIATLATALKEDARIQLHGFMSRQQLARHMVASDVFVFPSLAEGSARVIFMALAAGCYVITTPNSGSIVRDGVHGSVIPPGDTSALIQAISWAMAHRKEVADIGRRNAALIKVDYTQSAYGRNTVSLYKNLISRT